MLDKRKPSFRWIEWINEEEVNVEKKREKPMGVLDGIRVIEWGAFHIGPAAGAMLGDLGAEVIKVEEPGKGDKMRGLQSLFGLNTMVDGRMTIAEDLNRNKKGIALNLKHPKGKEMLLSLIDKSDVFLTNYLPGTLKRMGLDYETLHSRNPRLVYASATAYGTKGPESHVSALETVLEAKAGMMMTCGEPDMPPIFLVPGIADRGGAILLAYSVLAALLGRERHEIVQETWTSGLGALIALQSPAVAVTGMTGQKWHRVNIRELPPLYSLFPCEDGRWIVIASIEETNWKPFCEVMGAPELADDPKYATREAMTQNMAELRDILERLFATRTAREWEKAFIDAKLRASVAQTLEEAISDPQTVANEYVIDYQHPALGRTVKMVGFPVQFSEMPVKIRCCAPEVGEHTEEVLMDILGCAWQDIEQLKGEGVI